jgi:hypothetical protein
MVAPIVMHMPRPVPPQVIPRPADWRNGDPAPWAMVPDAARRDISLDRVRTALAAYGQAGPVPEGIGTDQVLVPAVVVEATEAPETPTPDRAINAAVLAVLFEEDGEARLIFTRRSTSLRAHR